MPTPQSIHWSAAARTDRGRLRPANEDAFLAREDLGLFAVADGMGGHAAGEVASAVAIEVAGAAAARALDRVRSAPRLEEALREAVRAAHLAILERAAREPAMAGMGTTLTLLARVPHEDTFRIAHVGDSRAYRLRGGALRQLTTDHTLVQQLVDRGELTPGQARTHPLSNVLTRALGVADQALEVDLVGGEARPGDLLLLCSDGLSGRVGDEELRALLERDLPLEELADQLVEAANLRGGTDNITVVLVRAGERRPPAARAVPAP